MADQSIIWIDWSRHLRTQSLAARLQVDLAEIVVRGPRIFRYSRGAWRTASLVHAKRPSVVIATNPSIVLGLVLLFLRGIYRFKLVADAHYFGVVAPGDSRLFKKVLDAYNKRVDLVIVTNDNQSRALAAAGAKTFVCQDPLPELASPVTGSLTMPDKSAFLICSFDIDEPYEAVFEAFSELADDGFSLCVSGNFRKAQIDPDRYLWVRLLGFLSDAEYLGYLRSCDVIIDLTSNEDCLVCGAYEAMAAKKPLVLSRTTALRDYFGEAAVLVENTPAAIGEGVREAYSRRFELRRAVESWVAGNEVYMRGRVMELKTVLGSLTGRKTS